MNPKMITVGAAVQDVFLSGKVFAPHIENGKKVEEFLADSKYELESIVFSTGGGATNAAVTFARQGLPVSFMGKIAHDPAGMAVVSDLQNDGVDTSLIAYDQELSTGYSTLLVAPDGSRTIFVYRGASEDFRAQDFDFNRFEGNWVYISSLAGDMEFAEHVVHVAKEKGMKVAINPGRKELEQADRLKQLLHRVDVLSVNKEELQLLVEGDSDEALVRHASDMAPTTIMTDGPNGVTATDRRYVVKAGMYEDVPVLDRTGAGDAFSSGLVAQLALGASLKDAIVFASANSTSVVGQVGAKGGILHRGVALHDMPVQVHDF